MHLRGLILSILLAPLASAELKVASLHPLISDLLRQVGGDKVQVIDLIGPTGDPHSFAPQAKDIAAAEGSKVYFVSGMELETYLPELKAILRNRAPIVEVGSTLPSLHGVCDHEEHVGEDHEGHEHETNRIHTGGIPSISFRRAISIVEKKLSEQSPSDAEVFAANAAAYRTELDDLEKWVKREVIRIPRDERKLATAHSAFQYFCEAYGFESFSVQGLNREQMPDAVSLAKLISTLKEEKVTAIFPEMESNPKILQSLTRDTGIRLGGELIADGRGVTSYTDMMRANVTAIVSGLSE